jgi:hypothetical protein
MKNTIKAASVAAFLITLAFLIHNFNASYYEPVVLGFEKPTDYADMAKIANANWSFAFTSSGIAHIVTGFSMIFLGLGLMAVFRNFSVAASRLIVVSSFISGLGFLLTGISDIPGTYYGDILSQQNPDYSVNILLMKSMFRGSVNTMAIVGLSWFAGQVAWCSWKSGLFNKWFAGFGYVNALPGLGALVIPFIGFAYLRLAPLWMLWLGFLLWKQANADNSAAAGSVAG